jgi:hypothetical protein
MALYVQNHEWGKGLHGGHGGAGRQKTEDRSQTLWKLNIEMLTNFADQ